MSDLTDARHYMPDETALATIRQAMADYNAGRPSIARSVALRVPAMTGAYAAAAAALAYGSYGEITKNIYGMLLGGLAYGGVKVFKHARKPADDYQLSLRYQLLPVIFSFVDDFRFSHGLEAPFLDGMSASKILAHHNGVHDDMIRGRHDGLDFTLAETELATGSGKSRTVIFKGAILHFRREHPFPGLLFATRKANAFDAFMRDLFGSSLAVLTTGRRDLDRDYEFRTDNVAEADKLIDGTLGKALDWLRDGWPDGTPQIGFRQNECYLILPSARNRFELPGIHEDIDFETDIRPMIRDMVTLLAIAHLVRKIGTD